MERKETGGLDVLAGYTASSRGTTYENNIYFERCMDLLARMIEKYGDRIEFPDPEMPEQPEQPKSIKETIAELQSKSANEAKQAQTGQKPKKKRDRGLDR